MDSTWNVNEDELQRLLWVLKCMNNIVWLLGYVWYEVST